MQHSAIIAAIVSLAAVAPAFAGTQVIAGNGMTLTEAAQVKFNRDTRQDDRQPIVVPGTPSGDYGRLAASVGLSEDAAAGMSLAEIFVVKVNHETPGNTDQIVKGSAASMATRSPFATSPSHDQLVASAGLSPAEARGLSLTDIAAEKFAKTNYR